MFQQLPEYLQLWATSYGSGLYLILALILFAETGLIVTPFLPGDSLLFATGAVLAFDLPGLDIYVMGLVMIAAVFCGDVTNYLVGRKVAKTFFKNGHSKWLNKKHLDRTHQFYKRHGGRTIVLARFVPIVRTYAPFVGGLSGMTFSKYISFSIIGAIVWITAFLSIGYYFGNMPSVKSNFHYVILAILVLSVLPIAFEFWRDYSAKRSALQGVQPGSSGGH